jgi:IS5 family transposase
MTVFIIVENLPVVEHGEEDIHECVLATLGYFTDENVAEAKSVELTNKHLGKIRKRDVTENDETRFGYLALELANGQS